MTPFQKVMSAAAGLLVVAVIVGGSIYGYNRIFSDSTRDDIAATVRQEIAKARGNQQVPPASQNVAEIIREELRKAGIVQQPQTPANPQQVANNQQPPANPQRVQALEVEVIPLNAQKTNTHAHALQGQQCAGNEGKKVRVAVTHPTTGAKGWDYYTCPKTQ